MRRLAAALAGLVAAAFEARADVADLVLPLERLDEALHVESADRRFRLDLSGHADLEGWLVDEKPPGLVFGSDGDFLNPRLVLFADAQAGETIYALVQARVDRGFDPRLAGDASARFDEYLLRWSPLGDRRLSVQVGKFATVFGAFVAHHDVWKNPFVTAPLAYENVFSVADDGAPASADDFLARRDVPDLKRKWMPIVWGPSYATGAALFGELRRLDWAIEVKNASLSSRPSAWEGRERGFSDPTVSGRAAWRPATGLQLGVSGSHGSYLLEKSEGALPAGRDAGDYEQTAVGADAEWVLRKLELRAEGILSRFEVPRVGDADTAACSLEGRYQILGDLFWAVRFGQQLFGTVDDGAGRERAFDRDVRRIETALTWRFARRIQTKLQYGYTDQRGSLEQGEQLAVFQVSVRF